MTGRGRAVEWGRALAVGAIALGGAGLGGFGSGGFGLVAATAQTAEERPAAQASEQRPVGAAPAGGPTTQASEAGPTTPDSETPPTPQAAEERPPAQTAEERRAELAAVVAAIKDPDPLMRLASLDTVIKGGDPLKIELAVRTAMGVDDPQLKSLAMQVYMSRIEELAFSVEMPGEIQAELEAAKGDDEKLKAFNEKHGAAPRGFLWHFNQFSGRFTVRVQAFDPQKTDFQVFALLNLEKPDEKYSGKGSLTGAKLTMRSFTYFRVTGRTPAPKPCTLVVRPTPELKLEGEMSCDGLPGGRPLRVSASML